MSTPPSRTNKVALITFVPCPSSASSARAHLLSARSRLTNLCLPRPPLSSSIRSGGTKGIGRATALHIATLGFDSLALSYASSKADFEETEQLINKLGLGTTVFGVQADLGQAEVPAQVIRQVVDKFGGIDVLINNAVSA